MPKINHKNIGDVQKHEYLTGIVEEVFPENEGINPAFWDTAHVLIPELGITWFYAPIFYHCSPEAKKRENGAIVAGSKGFSVQDEVILLCEINTAQVGQQLISSTTIIGHKDGIKKCAYNCVIVRAGLTELEPFDINDLEKNKNEFCILFDVEAQAVANFQNLTFPCPVNDVKPFLRYAEIKGVPLFEEFDQGAEKSNIEIAGFSPNWKDDLQGDNIRGDLEADAWWTSYDYFGNPVINLFRDLCFDLMFERDFNQTLNENATNIKAWDNNSKAFKEDYRSYELPRFQEIKTVDGVAYSTPHDAVGADGFKLLPAESKHIQTAFGEDEFWYCAVNSYQGMIVSYCDAKWKFVRMPEPLPNIPIPGVIENWEKLANTTTMTGVLPGLASTGSMLNDISFGLASEITLSGKGGENSLWSWGMLKRINEGCFHCTTHPALKGSKALKTTLIPESPADAKTRYWTALNKRYEHINAWYRPDNWQNTFDCATASFGVDVTWWFTSEAQKWEREITFIDTPIGSMWLKSPSWKAAVWLMHGLSTSVSSARQDRSLLERFDYSQKHSRSVVAQIYIAQRTSITLWSSIEDKFIKQELYVDPYNSIPEAVEYAKMSDSSLKHINDLTEEDYNDLLSDRKIFISSDNEQPVALALNRNEIEIMASADLYGKLQQIFTVKNPINQTRNSNFESCIKDLINKITEDVEAKAFPEIYFDMEII